MKLFAYYLPQYHSIPENDKWWGKGFTEWVNVKRAKPYFKGHVQPKHPLDNNYYSLNNVKTLEWQSSLLNQYNVDGLIFYHYYFEGKKLLEKPAEMLLKNKNIDMKYFFCWANHSWFKSWDGTKKLLIEQTYGDIAEWEEHFNYLLNFFKDDRYEKHNNKPIFLIFKSDFKEKYKMFEFFDKKCKENGFDGICIIETYESSNKRDLNRIYKNITKNTEYIHLREPGTATNKYFQNPTHIFERVKNIIKKRLKKVKIYDGNKLFMEMIKTKIVDKKIIRGLFFEWDNTPRHSTRGYVITPPQKSIFIEYLNSIKDNEYVFINAWNEWCEGMMLEPTEENKYKYLEWIRDNHTKSK